MRLLSFPDVARWYMEKLFPWERRIVTAMGPIVQPFVPVPLPKDNVYAAIEVLFTRIDGMKEVLCDPKRSSIRLVLNPEKMVIKEAQRALTYLNLYGYVTDAVICNRVFPRQLEHGYFAEWSHIQGRYREMIQRGFSPIPIWEIPFFDREVVGLPHAGAHGQEHLRRSGSAADLDVGSDPDGSQERGSLLSPVAASLPSEGGVVAFEAGR
ncbi:MAG: arsenical pump-driving ATPase GET3 [Candidatus Methylomirabilis sp.]|nr:arsenical pump-driving ATPase GET3 [Candidatus Methylomirabilis sp.]